jgi:hypothetical protein
MWQEPTQELSQRMIWMDMTTSYSFNPWGNLAGVETLDSYGLSGIRLSLRCAHAP